MSVVSDTCPTPMSVVEATFESSFENTAAIEFWHRAAIRYGNSGELSNFVDGDDNEQEDYLRGLLASSITIFCLAVVWMILLWGFKCVGPYGVGWISGREIPLHAPPEPQHYSDDPPATTYGEQSNGDDQDPNESNVPTNTVESYGGDNPPDDTEHPGAKSPRYQHDYAIWQEHYRKANSSRNICRGIVIFACISIVISSSLMASQGVSSLVQSIHDMADTVSVAKELCQGGIDLIDQTLAIQTDTRDKFVAAWDEINHMCPRVRDPICSDLLNVSTCEFDEVFNDTAVGDLIDTVGDIGNTVYSDLVSTREDLVDMMQTADDMKDVGDTFNWAFWLASSFAITLAVICLVFMIGMFIPLNRPLQWFQALVLIPVFILLLILSWVFAMVFVIGSIGLADMCYNGPDERFLTLLDKHQDSLSSLIYKAVVYYVKGCPADIVPEQVMAFLEYVARVIVALDDATQSLDRGFIPGIGCPSTVTDNLVALTSGLSDSMCDVSELIRDLRLFFKCDSWYPLYETSVYSAMCYNATDGFAWVSATQIVIVLMAMVILTFRIGFYEIEVEGPPAVIDTQKEQPPMEQPDEGVEQTYDEGVEQTKDPTVEQESQDNNQGETAGSTNNVPTGYTLD